MNEVDLQSIITFASIISSFVFAYLAFRKDAKAEDKNEGKEKGEITTMLGGIKEDVSEVKQTVSNIQNKYVEMSADVANIKGKVEMIINSKK